MQPPISVTFVQKERKKKKKTVSRVFRSKPHCMNKFIKVLRKKKTRLTGDEQTEGNTKKCHAEC